MARVSMDDLAFAAAWMEAYDPAPDEEGGEERRDRVIEWLNNEIAKRETDAMVRRAAKQHSVKPSAARRALARRAAATA